MATTRRQWLQAGAAAVIVGLGFRVASRGSAQSAIPNGVFVRDSAGQDWLILRGKRVAVPLWQASDADIAALPTDQQWAVLSVTDDGAMVAGSRPAWLDSQPGPASPPATATSATFEGLTLTVLRVERPWKSDNQFIRAKAGMEYLTVDVRFDNTTTANLDYSIYGLKVAAADGTQYEVTGVRTPTLSNGQVLPGTPVRGWLGFEVPIGLAIPQLLWRPRYDRTLPLSLTP